NEGRSASITTAGEKVLVSSRHLPVVCIYHSSSSRGVSTKASPCGDIEVLCDSRIINDTSARETNVTADRIGASSRIKCDSPDPYTTRRSYIDVCHIGNIKRGYITCLIRYRLRCPILRRV